MAVVRNIADDDRNIPLAGGEVKAGDTFEIDDDVIWQYEWPEAIFEVVDAPPKPEPEPEPDGPPAKNANKPEWVAYAVSQGASPEDADNMTVAELIATYGQEN